MEPKCRRHDGLSRLFLLLSGQTKKTRRCACVYSERSGASRECVIQSKLATNGTFFVSSRGGPQQKGHPSQCVAVNGPRGTAPRASLRRYPRSHDPHTAVDWLGGRLVASSAVHRKMKRSVAWSFSGDSDRPAQSWRLSDVPFEEQRPSLSKWPTPQRDHSDRCAAQAHANTHTHTHARGSFVL